MQIQMDGRYLRGKKIIGLGRYPGGGLAIRVVGDCALSVNPVNPVPAGSIAIKNWGECEGIEPSLVRAGLIEALPHMHMKQGFVNIPVYRLVGKLAQLSHGEQEKVESSLDSQLEQMFPNATVITLG